MLGVMSACIWCCVGAVDGRVQGVMSLCIWCQLLVLLMVGCWVWNAKPEAEAASTAASD